MLGNISLATSLVGDPAAFLQGVSLGAQWLEENRVDACLVIGAEETNWILADALWHLERPAILTAGAGALCLCREREIVGRRRTGRHHRRAHLFLAKEPDPSRPRHAQSTGSAGILPASRIAIE